MRVVVTWGAFADVIDRLRDEAGGAVLLAPFLFFACFFDFFGGHRLGIHVFSLWRMCALKVCSVVTHSFPSLKNIGKR